MPSPFDALNAALSGAVMSTFGETADAILRPRTRSEFAEGQDPDRPARPIRGVFTDAPADPKLRGAAGGSEFSGVTRLSVQQPEFWVSAATVAALPYPIRPQDHVAFPARAGAPVYSISEIHMNDMGDLNLILVAAE